MSEMPRNHKYIHFTRSAKPRGSDAPQSHHKKDAEMEIPRHKKLYALDMTCPAQDRGTRLKITNDFITRAEKNSGQCSGVEVSSSDLPGLHVNDARERFCPAAKKHDFKSG
jgi:hypothetical protein